MTLQAVYHMPTYEEDYGRSLPLALQSLFYKVWKCDYGSSVNQCGGNVSVWRDMAWTEVNF